MIRGGYIQKRIYVEWKAGPNMFIQSQIILVAPPSQIQRPCESSFNEEGRGHNTSDDLGKEMHEYNNW